MRNRLNLLSCNYGARAVLPWMAALLLAVLFTPVPFIPMTQAATSRSIALTFDDVPMAVVGNDHIAGPLEATQRINREILATLRRHHATAIGFVNEAKLNVQGERDARAAILEEWLAGGMLLGNHGYSHVQFSDITLQKYEEEFVRGDVITAPLMQQHKLTERYFRHPYLDTGDTQTKKQGFDAFLTAHNYTVAPVTMQNEDWMFNAPYTEARKHSNMTETKRVRDAYLAHTTAMFASAEDLARSTFGHEIPLVIMLHDDLLNAESLDAVLSLMEQRGYRFISLPQALADSAYSTPDTYYKGDGISWLDRWQLAFGKPVQSKQPEPPPWVQQQYDAITAPAKK
ncbi:MAG: polysaccharide deacetylase family protein [Acidobacteriaceae bacterium]